MLALGDSLFGGKATLGAACLALQPPALLQPVRPSGACSPRIATSQGGTRSAPTQFNDRNRQEPGNFWPSAAGCAYVASLRDPQSGALIDTLGEWGGEGRWLVRLGELWVWQPQSDALIDTLDGWSGEVRCVCVCGSGRVSRHVHERGACGSNHPNQTAAAIPHPKPTHPYVPILCAAQARTIPAGRRWRRCPLWTKRPRRRSHVPTSCPAYRLSATAASAMCCCAGGRRRRLRSELPGIECEVVLVCCSFFVQTLVTHWHASRYK